MDPWQEKSKVDGDVTQSCLELRHSVAMIRAVAGRRRLKRMSDLMRPSRPLKRTGNGLLTVVPCVRPYFKV